MNFILGKKIRMTQIFTEDGMLIPVTEVSVAPNTVLRVKDKERDGYEAIILAYGTRNKIKKSLEGLFNKLGKFRYIKEFRTEGHKIILKTGDQIGLDSFKVGDKIKATAVSKGKGFQGVVKRHGFHGTNEQHGNKDQSRMPGSIGATGPAHVFKGTRMAGRMGGDQVTLTNLEIVKIDLDNNLLYLKGAFAGGNNALVAIKGEGEFKVYEKPTKVDEKEEKNEEAIQEVNEDKKEIEEEDAKLEELKIEEKKEEVLFEDNLQKEEKKDLSAEVLVNVEENSQEEIKTEENKIEDKQ